MVLGSVLGTISLLPWVSVGSFLATTRLAGSSEEN